MVSNKSASVAQPPCCQQQVRLRGTTALLSARRSSSSYGHLAIKFQSNRICDVRRDAAIIAYGIDEFIAKSLAVVSGRPNLASLGGHRLEENNKALWHSRSVVSDTATIIAFVARQKCHYDVVSISI